MDIRKCPNEMVSYGLWLSSAQFPIYQYAFAHINNDFGKSKPAPIPVSDSPCFHLYSEKTKYSFQLFCLCFFSTTASSFSISNNCPIPSSLNNSFIRASLSRSVCKKELNLSISRYLFPFFSRPNFSLIFSPSGVPSIVINRNVFIKRHPDTKQQTK